MTARAAVFDGPGKPFRLADVALPTPGPGECVVRVSLATVCGSDLHTIAGKRIEKVPCVLGHEAVGVVEVVGDGVRSVDDEPVGVGDRVTWTVAASCGRCFYCGHGLPQKCDTLKKYGKEPPHPARGPSGTLATHVHLWPGTGIVRVPDELPDEVASPAMCATATSAACLRSAGPIHAGDLVLVYGLGMLGLTATAMAAAAGAYVFACDTDLSRVARAREFGVHTAHIVGDRATEGAALDELAAKSARRGADLALELSGANEAAGWAQRYVRYGGTIILAGAVFPTKPLFVDHERLVRKCLTIRGVHNYTPADLLTAVRFLAAHHTRFPFASLVERTFPLDEIDAAVEYARDGRPVRVGIRPSG